MSHERPADSQVRPLRDRLVAWTVGDRRGLALSLGLLLVYVSTWRLGIFITDSTTLLNMVAALADGHLHLVDPVYSSNFDTPGTYTTGDRVYGRNYGQAFLSLPLLFVLRLVTVVTPLPVAIAAAWSVGLLAFAVVAGREVGRPAMGAYLGSAGAVVSFVGNLLVLRPVSPPVLEQAAAQLTTAVAAALLCVLVYRVVARDATSRLGLGASLVVGLATPVGIWATIPKRHVVSALLVLVLLAAFQRSRDPATPPERLAWYRGGAYAAVGLLAWFHPAEGAVAFVSLAVVDLPTAPSNDRRTLAVVAGALLVGALPFFLTNLLVTGNPLKPIRFLQETGYIGGKPIGAIENIGSDPGGAAGGSAGRGTVIERLGAAVDSLPVVGQLVFVVSLTLDLYGAGVQVAVQEPLRTLQVFVHQLGSVPANDTALSRGLSVLESVPVLGAAAAVVGGLAGVDWPVRLQRLRGAISPLGLLLVALSISYVCLFLPYLPTRAQVTVRYFVPLYPLAVVGLARLPLLQRLVHGHFRDLAAVSGIGLVAAVPLVGAYVAVADLSLQGVVIFHGYVSLAAAATLAVSVLAASLDQRFDRVAALALAASVVAGALFVLLAGWFYFGFSGPHALPLVRFVSDAVALV